VACSPQAWAAAAVFSVLQSCLGLEIDAAQHEVTLRSPRLPEFIDRVHLQRLAVGSHSVDMVLQRYKNNVGIDVVRKDGPVRVVLGV